MLRGSGCFLGRIPLTTAPRCLFLLDFQETDSPFPRNPGRNLHLRQQQIDKSLPTPDFPISPRTVVLSSQVAYTTARLPFFVRGVSTPKSTADVCRPDA